MTIERGGETMSAITCFNLLVHTKSQNSRCYLRRPRYQRHSIPSSYDEESQTRS